MEDTSEREAFLEIERTEERIKQRLREAERLAEDKVAAAKKEAEKIISEKEKSLNEARAKIEEASTRKMAEKEKTGEKTGPALLDQLADYDDRLDRMAKIIFSQIIVEER